MCHPSERRERGAKPLHRMGWNPHANPTPIPAPGRLFGSDSPTPSWRSAPRTAKPLPSRPSCGGTTSCCSAPPAASSRATPRAKTWFRRPICSPGGRSAAFAPTPSSPPGWCASSSTRPSAGCAGAAPRSSPWTPPSNPSIPRCAWRWRTIPTIARSAAPMRAEVRRLIEARIDLLPEAFRAVFMLRAVEEMSVEEVAARARAARGDGADPLLSRPRTAARRPVARRRPGDRRRLLVRRRALRPDRRRRAEHGSPRTGTSPRS